MSTLIAPTNPLYSLVSAFKKAFRKDYFTPGVKEKKPIEAYDLWAQSYDVQPGNLMLDMDEEIFTELLSEVNLTGKQIADIGCGTGRYWPMLLNNNPAGITGFDASAGMLKRLEQKFPDAKTIQVTDNKLSEVANAAYDTIISTLTVAHIEHIEETLAAWSRILKYNSDIIITDFHPNALAHGVRRTFQHNKDSIAIENFIHYVYDIEGILINNGFRIVNKIEKRVDESVKHYYEANNAMEIYERFKDARILYGIHLKRTDDLK